MRRRVFIGLGLAVTILGAVGAWFLLAGRPPPPTVAEVRYGPADAQTFDVWLPEGAGPFLVVVYVHGGAFRFGDKRMADGLREDIAALRSAGIAVASTNYRMSGEALFPAAVQDVVRSIAALRRDAVALKINPAKVAIWGKSAGGNIALLAGLSAGGPPFGAARTGRLSAIVAMYPPISFGDMDAQLRASACGAEAATHGAAGSPESTWLGGTPSTTPDRVRAASPLTYVTKEAPPVLLQAGTADCLVPPAQSRMLANALRKVGTPMRFGLLPGAKHIDPVFDEPANLAVVVPFLRSALSRPTPP